MSSYVVVEQKRVLPLRGFLDNMSDYFFYLRFKFTPKIGHTFTDEREVAVEVPKGLVKRKSKLLNEGQMEVIALDLAKSAALRSFPTESERALNLYGEASAN